MSSNPWTKRNSAFLICHQLLTDKPALVNHNIVCILNKTIYLAQLNGILRFDFQFTKNVFPVIP